MDKPSHSPGPWTFDYSDEKGGQWFWVASKADARLIAAAPELLETLKALEYAASVCPGVDASVIYEARAAIDKATGGE